MKYLIGLLFTILAFDGVADTSAKIEKILMYEQGDLVYVYPEGGVDNPPFCHGANGDYLSFRMSRPMAKEYLSLLMMAFVTQKEVVFKTERKCVDQSVSETIRYLTVIR